MQTKINKTSENIVARSLNWLQTQFFTSGVTSQKQMLAAEKTPVSDKKLSGYVRKLLIATSSFIFLALYFYASVIFYPNTARRISESPLVTNLKEIGFETKYKFGNSPTCGEFKEFCWNQIDHDDSDWAKAKFPETDIKNLLGYEEGFKAKSIFYRLQLDIPQELIDQPNEIAFSPMYVNHSAFSMYINGRLVHSATSINQTPPIASISIPKDDIKDGKVLITIHGSRLNKLDLGLFHRSAWYLGPEPTLRGLFVHRERASYTFYLLFLLGKGGIFLIFSLIFIFTNGQRGFFSFLIFAFCVTVESLFIGDFLNSSFNISARVIIIFYLKTIGTIGLLGFFTKYYGIRRSGMIQLVTGAIFFTLITLGLIDQNLKTFGGKIGILTLFDFSNWFLVITLVVSLVFGFVTLRMWKVVDINSSKLVPLKAFIAVSFLYLAANCWEFFFKGKYAGFDMRAVNDMIFFLFVAVETIREFGFNKKRVLNLESHMVEKKRMELELQDAAEISRVFVPASSPTWEGLQISTYHKPLTESGGDWFAFEESKSKKFYYFFMCDVTGHGVQAAIIVSTCRTILTALKNREEPRMDGIRFIETYINDLNRTLFLQGDGRHVSTICALGFDRENKKIFYITGGHPSPIYLKNGEKTPSNLKILLSRNNVLGASEKYKFTIKEHPFDGSDEIMTFTDGLPVNRNIRSIRKSLSDLPGQEGFKDYADKLVSIVQNLDKERTTTSPEEDDVTVVCFKAAG